MIDKTELTEKYVYRVLARKYRPKFFSELIGQENLVKTITNAIKLNRIAHAYLLTGVRGIGKTTTARLIARALNCENLKKNDYEPCGDCELCKSIFEESNMDVIEMDAASRTGVDDVREIIDNIKYKPTTSKYKVYIIDEVHMLSKNAFNALLKTLEEPPSHVKFIFATTEVHKIPITILSRCQRFDLHRIDYETLTKYLINIAKKENVKITSDAVALIVRAADGSVRDGLSLLDQTTINVQDDIRAEHVVKMLGLSDRGKIYDLLDSIFQGEAQQVLNLFKKLHIQGADPLMVISEMLQIIHFLTEIKILPSTTENPYIPELERTKGAEMANKLTISLLGRYWQILFKGYQELQQTSHIYQTSEMIIIRLLFLSDFPPPSDLVKKIEEYEKNEIKNNVFDSKNQNEKKELINKSVQQELKTENNLNLLVKKIHSFRELVELFHKYREALNYTRLYNDVKLISFEEGKIEINVKSIKDKYFIKNITKLISKWTGRIWTVISSDNTTGKSLAEEDVIIKQKKLEEIKKEPDILKILNTFPGSAIYSFETIKDKENEKDNINKLAQEEK